MAMKDFAINDLSGGVNEADPPTAVPPDQCLEAVNVEFARSTLGERRPGAASVTVSTDLDDNQYTSFLHRHLPSSDETAAELWAFSLTVGGSSDLCRKTTTWSTISPVDAITFTGVYGFKLKAQSLHGKMFLAYKSAVDRLHVWDGTNLRRVGMLPPAAAPTGANTGAGTFAGVRYYRTRETVQVATVTTHRSEPSATLTHTPSGTGTGVIVTKPTTINTSPAATHWELEASLNNVDFYRIATTVVGTATSTDSVAITTGYAASGTLSEDSGDYTVPISCKHLAADEDRLLMAGSYETAALGSRVSWTPVYGDPGVGNDERVPIDTNNFLDLDTHEGGEITGISNSINGIIYVFKRSHIYKLIRTGQRNRAYEAIVMSKTRGALENSLVAGVDQAGNACLYFLDPNVGPCRVGQDGLRICGQDVSTTWGTVNLDATLVVCAGVFYPSAGQVHFFIATGAANVPDKKLVLQTDHQRETVDGIRRGWSTGTGPSATAISTCLFADNVNTGAARNLVLKPFVGVSLSSVASILMLDSGTTDGGTAYFARVKTRPYTIGGILNQFGIMTTGVLAKAAAGVTFYIRAIRDFGLEEKTRTAELDAVGAEDHVIKQLDSLNFAELHTIQLEYGDDPDEVVAPDGTWEIQQIAFKPRMEQTG